jgi:hypothetical protein
VARSPGHVLAAFGRRPPPIGGPAPVLYDCRFVAGGGPPQCERVCFTGAHYAVPAASAAASRARTRFWPPVAFHVAAREWTVLPPDARYPRRLCLFPLQPRFHAQV